MIYLDNGATTFPKPESVLRAVNMGIMKYGGNPGRGGHNMAIKASEEIYKCRQAIARLYNCDSPEKVVFTNNCTTALNTVIKGILKPGDHVVVSCLEHNAVMRPLETLKKQGISVSEAKIYPYDDEKTIDSFRKEIRDNTALVVCIHISNVFGFVLPVERITALCHMYEIPVCIDTAQSAGIYTIDLQKDRIDYLCGAGHKSLYGPMGTGFLIVNNDILPLPLTEGGTGSNSISLLQPEILPDRFESGTPNLPGILGLKAGVEFVERITPKRIFNHEMRLIRNFYNISKTNNKLVFYNDFENKTSFAPVLSINIKDIESEKTAAFLNNKYKIAVRAGLHCCPMAHKFMGTDKIGTVRIVPSIFTKTRDMEILDYALRKI